MTKPMRRALQDSAAFLRTANAVRYWNLRVLPELMRGVWMA